MHFDNKKKGILDFGKGEAIVSYSFVAPLKIYQFKAKGSEIKPYPLCLDKISNDFTTDNMKKTGLKGVVKFFLFITTLLILTTFYVSIDI